MGGITATIDGTTRTLYAWANIYGVNPATIYKRYHGGQRGKALVEPDENGKQTLCWECDNYAGGCSWSRDFVPVEGWTAVPTIVGSQHCVKGKQYPHEVQSFLVRQCPCFVPDPPRRKSRRRKKTR